MNEIIRTVKGEVVGCGEITYEGHWVFSGIPVAIALFLILLK